MNQYKKKKLQSPGAGFSKTKQAYIYCTNCGRKGHEYKSCKEPIISLGIILIRFEKDVSATDIFTKNPTLVAGAPSDTTLVAETPSETSEPVNDSTQPVEINMIGIRANDVKDLELFSKVKDGISFLMIRRKHTLGYIEFIRGRYKPDNFDGIIFLFQQMTKDEISKIARLEFEELWDDFWGDSDKKVVFEREYLASKEKFDTLKQNKIELGIDFYTKHVKPSWDQAEWGFPKGRRNKNEDNLECAIREFQEESGFKKTDIILVDGIDPLVEDLIGTNGVRYRHIYYIAIAANDKVPIIDDSNFIQNSEIGAIEYVTYDSALKIIRPYHTSRKNLLTKLYNYVLNKLICETNG